MPMPPLAQSHPEAPAQGCSSSCAVRHLNDVYEHHRPCRKGHFRHVISTIYEYSARSRRWATPRSEEHTSKLQSLAYLVCRLLLEKKKKTNLPAHGDTTFTPFAPTPAPPCQQILRDSSPL